MKKLTAWPILISLTVLLLTACGKGGGTDDPPGPPPPPVEADITLTTDPTDGAVLAPAPGPFGVKITVTSAMPASGVRIEVTARKDDGSADPAFFTYAQDRTTAVTNVTIDNTPPNKQCLVQIKVTSKTKPTNTRSVSYRYASK